MKRSREHERHAEPGTTPAWLRPPPPTHPARAREQPGLRGATSDLRPPPLQDPAAEPARPANTPGTPACTHGRFHSFFCMVGRKKSRELFQPPACSPRARGHTHRPQSVSRHGCDGQHLHAAIWAKAQGLGWPHCTRAMPAPTPPPCTEATPASASLTSTASSHGLIILQIIRELAQHPIQQGV